MHYSDYFIENNIVEYIPEMVDDGIDLKRFKKISLIDLAALGIGFNSIRTAIINRGKSAAGGSGLYRVSLDPGQELMRVKNGPGYRGAIKAADGGVGGGQAVLDPIGFDPTMVFMAVVMMNIEHKLNTIQETQEEILRFLEQKEKAELKGNIIFMADILNNYKYNWNKTQYLENNHVKILDIKQKAEQSILFAQSRIKEVASKKRLINFSPDVKNKIQKLKSGFEDYQLAVYTYAMASYIETMLLRNFDKSYMSSVADKIENYSIHYRELYTDCYDILSDNYDSAIDTIVIGGVARASKAAGEALAQVPILGEKTTIDDNLIAIGDIMEDTDGTIKLGKLSDIISKQSSYVQPFVENVRTIGEIYNKPMTLMFDEENLYIDTPVA